jgi:hypothetical protein
MAGTFHLIDLVTQCQAVELSRVLAGGSDAEKIAWLSQHGFVVPIIQSGHHPGAKQAFIFRSAVSIEIGFFLDKGCFISLPFGDHTTFRPVSD